MIGTIETIKAELESLRDEVRALRADHRTVQIEQTNEHVWLGEPISLIVRVKEWDGSPASFVPLTLVATNGHLYASATGYGTTSAGTITTQTDINGIARVTLRATTLEPLLDIQHDALQVALSRLPRDSETPMDIVANLRSLAQQYRLPANTHLRRAIDIYYQTYRHLIDDRLNQVDELRFWAKVNASVVAYTGDDRIKGTGVQAITMHNWLLAWQRVLAENFQSGTLSDDLRNARLRHGRADTMQAELFERMRYFVDSEKGLVGSLLAKRITHDALNGFIENEFGELDLNQQTTVLPLLNVVANSLQHTMGSNVMEALGRTHVQLQTDLVEKGSVGAFDELDSRLAGVESTLGDELTSRIAESVSSQLENANLLDRTTVDNLIDNAVSDFITADGLTEQLNAQNFVTQETLADATSGFVTTATMETAITQATGDFITADGLTEQLNAQNFVTQETLADATSRFVTTATMETAITQATGEFVTSRDVTSMITETTSSFVTADTVDSLIKESTANLITEDAVTVLLNQATSDFVSETEFDRYQQTVTNQLNTKLNTTTFDTFQTQTMETLNLKADSTELTRLRSDFDTKIRLLDNITVRRDSILRDDILRP